MPNTTTKSRTKGVYFNDRTTKRLGSLKGRRFKLKHIDADGEEYSYMYVVPSAPTEFARNAMDAFLEMLEHAEETTT